MQQYFRVTVLRAGEEVATQVVPAWSVVPQLEGVAVSVIGSEVRGSAGLGRFWRSYPSSYPVTASGIVRRRGLLWLVSRSS